MKLLGTVRYKIRTNIWITMISGNPLVLEVSDIATFTVYDTCK